MSAFLLLTKFQVVIILNITELQNATFKTSLWVSE